ncbi:preprotein translocase subunit SecY [Lacticaseibacillus paracasei]|uniref:preprotein translocase subunit SecY n=1 Tax=Lacticaseibacillus paracasei TaxID=1597 RepID=UPI001C438398|nr:preprotein translocase subunit SecY [Lacticaseibacillus paracasei]QXJ68261.1 preprotein translocase subunit SecY [Lacticaseibacillus paracasei subsp. paracasei]
MRKHPDVVKRVLFTLMVLFVYGLGQQIVIPGFDVTIAKKIMSQNSLLQMFGITTGGQMNLPTLLSLGLGPYMTAMIVWQAITSLDLRSINNLSVRQSGFLLRVLTLVLASLQASVMVYYLKDAIQPLYLIGDNINLATPVAVLYLVTGAMFAVQIGTENASHGFGGTVSLIIPSIITSLPHSFLYGYSSTKIKLNATSISIAVVVTTVVFILGLLVYRAERRIPIQRPSLESAFSDSYLPLPFLAAGAMPFMFSNMLFVMPQQVIELLGYQYTAVGQYVINKINYNHWPGILAYAFIVLFLVFAFGLINLSPAKLARQLKERGDYVYHTTPGDATEALIMYHFVRLSLVGDLFLLLIGVLPLVLGMFIKSASNYSMYLGFVFIMITITDAITQQFIALWNKNMYTLFDDPIE